MMRSIRAFWTCLATLGALSIHGGVQGLTVGTIHGVQHHAHSIQSPDAYTQKPDAEGPSNQGEVRILKKLRSTFCRPSG